MRGLFFLTSLLSSIAVVKADFQTVITDLGNVQNYTTQLSGNALLYNGGAGAIAYALQVQSDAVQVYKIAKITIADANAAAAFTSSQSSSVYSTANSLSNVIKTALSNVVSKASTFGELKPIVLPALIQLKISTDSAFDAIIAKLASADKGNANTLKSQLDTAFNNAIVTYGGTAR